MDKVVKREVIVESPEEWNEHFWDSIDVMDLSPEQRKHFKEIMRKEVRK